MKTIHKAYKFRIEPTKDQENLLAKHFGSCRFVFNHYLNSRKESCLENKKSLSYFDNSKDLTVLKNHDVICVESLAVKKMMADHRFARELSDVSLGAFYEMLCYKAEWNDRTVIKIDRFFPSSKTCFNCNWIKQDLKGEKEWACSNCGSIHDRDLNAARNIKKQGLKLLNETGDAVKNSLSGCGMQSDKKQKREETLRLAGR